MSGRAAPTMPGSRGTQQRRRGKGKRKRAQHAKALAGRPRQAPPQPPPSPPRESRLVLCIRTVEAVGLAVAVLGFFVSIGKFFI